MTDTKNKKLYFGIKLDQGTITYRAIPFILLLLSVLLVFTTHFSWAGLAVCALSYFFRMFVVTGGMHRYFSHKSYKMNRFWTFIMALLSSTLFQKGPLWWAEKHRHHHAHSDADTDFHSPKHGFWHAHVLWFLYDETASTDYSKVKDLSKYPELVWLDKYWMIPGVLFAASFYVLGGWHMLVWGFFVSTFLLSNGTFTINSLTHVFGYRRYYTTDTSRNNWLLTIITLGEGWHNNHHRYQSCVKSGFFAREIDVTYYMLSILRFFRITSDFKPVPAKIIEEGVRNDKLRKFAKTRGEKFYPPAPGMAGVQEA